MVETCRFGHAKEPTLVFIAHLDSLLPPSDGRCIRGSVPCSENEEQQKPPRPGGLSAQSTPADGLMGTDSRKRATSIVSLSIALAWVGIPHEMGSGQPYGKRLLVRARLRRKYGGK